MASDTDQTLSTPPSHATDSQDSGRTIGEVLGRSFRGGMLVLGCSAVLVTVVTAVGASTGTLLPVSRHLTSLLTERFGRVLPIGIVVLGALLYGFYRSHRIGRNRTRGETAVATATNSNAENARGNESRAGTSDDSEATARGAVTICGTDTAATLTRAVETAESGLTNEAVNEARKLLQERAREAHVAGTGCAPAEAEQAVAAGRWTDNRTARAFLADRSEPVTYPLWRRLLGWFAPGLACRLRIQQTMAALRALAADQHTRTSPLQSEGETETADGRCADDGTAGRADA
jgi:hypothetical protein